MVDYSHLGEHVGASDVCMVCRNALADFTVTGGQWCEDCAPKPSGRNFGVELEAAAAAGDWDAYSRIWDERRAAEVDHDEARLGSIDDDDGLEREAQIRLEEAIEEGACPNGGFWA